MNAIGHLFAMCITTGLKIPLTGVTSDWSKAKVSKYEVTRLGFDPLDGCMDRGADRKTKVKSKLNLK